MEDALEAFHVPQQSRRIKLRITPPDQQQHYSNSSSAVYSPAAALQHPPRFDHYFPTATVVLSSSSTSPSPEQQLPSHSRFNSFLAATEINTGPDQMIPSSSSSGGSCKRDRVRDSEAVELLGNGAMVGAAGGGLNLSLATTNARGGGVTRCSRSAAAIAMAAAPAGPFTGYASILSRSRFLKPAEELLEGFCGGGGGPLRHESDKKNVPLLDDSIREAMEEDWTARVNVATDRCGSSNLISLLHEVYRRYRIYCQQMHSAVKSFESVAGLGNAAPFISFAIRAVSKHFHSLKNAILDQINFTSNSLVMGSSDGHLGKRSCNAIPFGDHQRKPSINNNHHHHHHNHHPVWRSQRGFPDKAVAVLKAWLFENFLHPYPTDSDKEMLARRTGLSRSQVSNWFTNARVRLWKPMVEEIHSLEKQVGEKSQQRKFTNQYPSSHQPSSDKHTHGSSPIQRMGFSLQPCENEPPLPQPQPQAAALQPQSRHHQNQVGLFPPAWSSNDHHNQHQLVPAAAGGGDELRSRRRQVPSNMYSSGGGDGATGMPWSTTPTPTPTYAQSVPFWLSK